MVFYRKDLIEATGKILEENGIRYPYSPDLRTLWEASNRTGPQSTQATCCVPIPTAN
jgi:hypothetical protein